MIYTISTLTKALNSFVGFATSYGMLTVLLVVALFALLAAGAFVSFKNGIFSKISYIVAIIVLIFSAIGAYTNMQPIDDLELEDPVTVKIDDVSSEGLVVRNQFIKRFSKTYPLTGITLLEDKDGGSYETMKTSILDLLGGKEAVVAKSKKYGGYVCTTASHVNLNNYLLSNGLARTSVKCPSSYVSLEDSAKQNRLGIHAVSSGVMVWFVWKYVIYMLISSIFAAISKYLEGRKNNDSKKNNKAA